jgi:hypothetical protein
MASWPSKDVWRLDVIMSFTTQKPAGKMKDTDMALLSWLAGGSTNLKARI